MYKWLMFLFFLSFSVGIQAQSVNSDILSEKFDFYHKIHFSTALFLHIDKSVYTNNERIWFGAYLVNQSENVHSLLNVFLVRTATRKVVLDGKFKLENGLSSGSLRLPDTIPSGSYRLISYTNAIDKKGFPVASFSVPIEIKSTTQQDFTSSITLLDSTIYNGAVRARITIKPNNPVAMRKVLPVLTYSVSKGNVHSAVMKGNELIITIPHQELAGIKPTLLSTVSYGKQVQHLSISLPEFDQKQIGIRFFPEGGNLSGGLPGVVGWEARTEQGNPIAVSGLLLKDNIVVDTIESNSYGIGSFRLIPDLKSIYTLKIRAGSYLQRDTLFTLPKVTPVPIGLHLPNAVVNDTLALSVYSHEKRPVQILIHNYQKAYVLFNTQALLAENHFRLPLHALPKGVTTVTVLDEAGRPLAERLFFAHYHESILTGIDTEKGAYAKDDSVKVKVKITNHLGEPLQGGVFSAAVVQDNRMRGNFGDIETSVYLNHNLGMLPQDPASIGFRNKEYLENILLIKGWRKYTWRGLMDNNATDTLYNYSVPEIKGRIKLGDKPLKSAVKVIALNSQGVSIIYSENDGTFMLNPDQLKAADGSKVRLIVNENKKYQIEVDDPYQKINARLAEHLDYGYNNSVINDIADQQVKGLQRIISLQTVEIKSNKSSNVINGFKGEHGANACGDYVDEFDYLNYEKSENRFKPVSGKTYKKRTDLEGRYFKVEAVYYTGCTIAEKGNGFAINGIEGGKEYYGNPDGHSDNEYRSTLYWRSGIITNAAGEAELKFKTGEFSDKFRIIIQGVTPGNLISGYGNFVIK